MPDPALRRRRPEWTLLIGILALAAGTWGFLALTDEVREGGTGAIDRTILLAFRLKSNPAIAIGPRWLQETERDLTALGGFTVLGLITLFSILLLVLHGRRLQALIFGVAVVFAQAISEAIKMVVDRPRPTIATHLDLTYSSSFPSGHATMAPVVYLTLAAIVVAGDPRRSARVLTTLSAALVVCAIGISRVYLGVHWPSDVLAGWTLGALIALVASWALHRTAPLHQQGAAVAPDTGGG